MNDSLSAFNWKGLVFSIVGLLSLFLIFLLLGGKKIASQLGPTWIFFILFILGLAMSTFSGSRFLAAGTFIPIISKILKTLGFVAFALLIITPILNWIKVTFFTYKLASYIMAFIIMAKWVLVRGSDIFHLLSK